MNILFVTSKPMFPSIDGGCKASKNFLDLLIQCGYSVTNFTVSTQKHPYDINEFPEYYQEKVKPFSIKIDTSLKVTAAIKALLVNKPYNFERFRSEQLTTTLLDYLDQYPIDIVIFDSLYSTPSLNKIRDHFQGKIYLRSHNIEYNIWKELADTTRNPLKKWYFKLISAQLEKTERHILKKVDGVFTISQEDEEELKSNFGIQNTSTIHYSQPEVKPITDYSNPHFYHLGSMNWQPNKDAVQRLTNSIFPSLYKKLPESKLIIAGSFLNKESFKVNDKNIQVVGFVEDLDQFYHSNGIFISPIESGSGVRIKLLEAMNYGAPIITSHAGAKGIELCDQLIICDTDTEFIERAIELSSNEEMRAKLGKKASKFVRENYSIERNAERLKEVLNGK
jgi:glycosyltransferase involved in cell wall biosynthesis